MKKQYLFHRERDLNTRRQFLTSLAYSGTAHILLVFVAVMFSMWTYKPRIIVPGYKVNLVSAPKAGSLLEPSVTKKKRKPKKKRSPKKTKKKKSAYKVKKKKLAKAEKRIAPKKDTQPEKTEKKTPPPKKMKREPDKKLLRDAKTPDVKPGKTMVAEGMPFKHIWYLKIIERKVNDNWVTHGIDISGKRKDPVVRFTILRDGAIRAVMMKESSGSRELDLSAVEAVRKGTPYPPLPDDFAENSLTIYFGFNYEQNQ